MGFDMDGVHPSVTRLQVHDDGGQLVYYAEVDAVTEVLDKESRTTLTEWFATNLADAFARGHTYLEFPQHYTWDLLQAAYPDDRLSVKVVTSTARNVDCGTSSTVPFAAVYTLSTDFLDGSKP